MLVAARYWQGDECVSSPSRRAERTGLRGDWNPSVAEMCSVTAELRLPRELRIAAVRCGLGQLARALRKPNCPGSVKHPQTSAQGEMTFGQTPANGPRLLQLVTHASARPPNRSFSGGRQHADDHIDSSGDLSERVGVHLITETKRVDHIVLVS